MVTQADSAESLRMQLHMRLQTAGVKKGLGNDTQAVYLKRMTLWLGDSAHFTSIVSRRESS